ncbi:MAG: hypothetical protein HY903_03080 [Deltaproteobacteria bacterium]|nr:hypothetical protein [Deltaproteobacteria bacterium]
MSRRLLPSAAVLVATLLSAGVALGEGLGATDAAPMQALPPPPPPPPPPAAPAVEPAPPRPSAPQAPALPPPPAPPAAPSPPPTSAPKEVEPQPLPASSPAPQPSPAPSVTAPAPEPAAKLPAGRSPSPAGTGGALPIIVKVPESGAASDATAPADDRGAGNTTGNAAPAGVGAPQARRGHRRGPWSHICVAYTYFRLTDILNEASAAGWELTGLTELEDQNLVCFRRPR